MSTKQTFPGARVRVLVFIVAYHAESTVRKVLERIPSKLAEHDISVLIIDDASTDGTFTESEAVRLLGAFPFPLIVLKNPINQGYGGNQKLGYRYAIDHGFDIVALVHGDGQYAPEALPDLLQPLIQGDADAVFGSRMLQPLAALKGGMPLYKYIGNKVLTCYENTLLGTSLSEFHSGYRLYSVAALRSVPFELNSNVFHFDTEIIIQFLFAGFRIKEVSIPTYYGDEICRVNGIRYAWDCVRAVTAAYLQRFHLLYRRNFDVQTNRPPTNSHYQPKLDADSSHTRALAAVGAGKRVVDLGCGPGVLAEALKGRNCHLTGVDRFSPAPERRHLFDHFVVGDLEDGLGPVDLGAADTVLLLDVIEHLKSPEKLCADLHDSLQANLGARVVVTTPNVAFWVVRLMLLVGQFNYGQRGILDMTHCKLFTFGSARRFFRENNFAIESCAGIPPPITLALGGGRFSRTLSWAHGILTRLLPGMFAYQIFLTLRPLPTVGSLLRLTQVHSETLRATPSTESPQ